MTAPVTAAGLLADLPGYAELLEACVEDGASIGFLHPMPTGEAEGYWRWVADGVGTGDILMWAVSDDHGPIATIQLHPASKPNGAHRAEIAKLMVHPRARGRGLAKQLMATAEQAARDLGRRLLVLDTVEGSVADGLYRRLGWTEAGKIPDYALKSGGGSEPTVVFWKSLGTAFGVPLGTSLAVPPKPSAAVAGTGNHVPEEGHDIQSPSRPR